MPLLSRTCWGVIAAGVLYRARRDASAAAFIVGGRTLTLPAFVASLVSTWYGGILGVGEYSFKYGISNWLVFGLPYYIAAFLFAVFLAKKARESEFLTIPDRLEKTYGKTAAGVGSIVVFLMTVPAAYVLMIGVLGEIVFGWATVARNPDRNDFLAGIRTFRRLQIGRENRPSPVRSDVRRLHNLDCPGDIQIRRN